MTRRPASRLAIALLACACGDAPTPAGGATSDSADASSDGSGGVPSTADDAGDEGPPSSSSDGAPDPDGASDSDASDGASESSGGEADGIPIFVAQGMVGRTTVSYDDGWTWVAERSWDLEGDPHLCGSTEPVVCFGEGSTCSQVWYDGVCSTGECDCGHSPGFSKGIAYGNGVFVATWGWGWPGAIATSEDGVSWETTFDNDAFGGLRFGGGRFVAASRTPVTSADGLSWRASAEADFQTSDGMILWSVRRFGVSDDDGGRFIAFASGEGWDVLVSSDGGMSWWRPSVIPSECIGEGPGAYGDIISGNGVILIVGGDGLACRSTDGGDTWTTQVITTEPNRIASSGVWTGEEFWFWGWGNRYSSPDGLTWTTTPITSDADVGPVARNEEGTLVAVNNVWLGYADQRFLRSEDGLTWTALPDGAYTPGHPIFFLVAGRSSQLR